MNKGDPSPLGKKGLNSYALWGKRGSERKKVKVEKKGARVLRSHFYRREKESWVAPWMRWEGFSA